MSNSTFIPLSIYKSRFEIDKKESVLGASICLGISFVNQDFIPNLFQLICFAKHEKNDGTNYKASKSCAIAISLANNFPSINQFIPLTITIKWIGFYLNARKPPTC